MVSLLFKNGLRTALGLLCSSSFIVGLSLLTTAATAQEDIVPTRLRIMAANTTSGNRQSYDPGEGTRIFQGLQPDIVLIQEFNIGDNSDEAVANWVQSTFGSDFDYYREDGAQIPNGVISRYPILSAGEWNDSQVSNRDFAWTQIDIPGDRDLWAVSVHFLTRSGSVRNAQAAAVRRLVEENIPEEDYLVVGGDFNTRNARESALRTLDSIVDTDEPYPTDQAGLIGTNSSRRRPYDWVFSDPDLDPLEVPVIIGNNTFPNGLVFDSRVYTPLSDVSPVERGDSGSTNMQHMAVIKDFVVSDSTGTSNPSSDPSSSQPPTEPPTASPEPVSPLAAPLQSCQTVSGVASSDRFQHYAVNVPENASQLEVNLSGAEDEDSDIDIYVRQGNLSTFTEYDFRPWLTDSNEQIVVNDSSAPPLSAGLWYISVDGYIPGNYQLSAVIDKCE